MNSGVEKEEVSPRIAGLIARMSLQEKLQQLTAASPNGNRRLGIPNLRAGECAHGLCVAEATSFPQPLALGSTWDPDLLERIGTVIAREARAVGIHQCFAPMLGLARDPRWGRVEESFGEDPHLVSRLGVAFIRGLQGMDAERLGRDRIVATPKHFVADGEPLRGANGAAMEISEGTLRETHMLPFEAAILEARAESIMPAHHALNRVPCHANRWLLHDIIREEWGFDGLVVSDCLDISKLYKFSEDSRHDVAASYGEAARLALEAGIDQELAPPQIPWNDAPRCWGKFLEDEIAAGRVTLAAIDHAVANVLRTKLRLGLLDDPDEIGNISAALDTKAAPAAATGAVDYDPWPQMLKDGELEAGLGRRQNWKDVLHDPAHAALALESARKAIVLLKNEGRALPLDRARIKRIAVIGPNAEAMRLGGYSTPQPKHFVSVLDGIRKAAGGSVEVAYAHGCNLEDASSAEIPAAVDAARAADVAVLVLGNSEVCMGENNDRDNLDLPGGQQALVEAVHATGVPMVVVLLNGGPLTIRWLHDHVPAILEGWYLGQETGTAVADVLFGRVNPGGRLPVSVPLHIGQVPCYYNELPASGTHQIFQSRYGCLYPFGHGLSYTTFRCGGLRPEKKTIGKTQMTRVRVTVTNTGDCAGDEVVQLYIHDDHASVVRPIKELKGFQRITLQAGESREVAFPVGFKQFRFWKNGQWIVEAGTFTLTVGPDSASGASCTLAVEKD